MKNILTALLTRNILTALLISTIFVGCAAKTAGGGGAPEKPKNTGNAKIDKFVSDAFAVYDEVQDMKKNLAELNTTLNDINNHPVGPIAWIKEDISKSVSKAKNSQLNPQALKEALNGKITGMIGNVKATLKGVETIQANIKLLLKTLPELPAEASSLGFKAPKALNSIKATGGMIKALPGELVSLAKEAEAVVKNCQTLLSSIGN